MKKEKLKELLNHLAKQNNATLWLDESKSIEISDILSKLDTANFDIVKKIIQSGSYMIKESIDFSDTDYILAQIVDIINED